MSQAGMLAFPFGEYRDTEQVLLAQCQREVYAGSERIEQFTDRTGSGYERLLYVHEDLQGNTRYYTKDNGQSFAELTYDAWGMPESPNKLLNNDHGNYVYATYTGHIFDTTLDIYFAEARFYDAQTRQWLAMDPIKDGNNWYQYCYSNPLRYWDPLGLEGFTRYGCGNLGWQGISQLINTVPPDKLQLALYESVRENLTDEQRIFISTVAGEAINTGRTGWEIVANVIMNRVGVGEWSEYDTVSEIIANTGFDAYTYKNVSYREAETYLNTGNAPDVELYWNLIDVVLPIYRGDVEDITQGGELYYSPKSMNPPGSSPSWNFSVLEQIEIPGVSQDDFMVYKYK